MTEGYVDDKLNTENASEGGLSDIADGGISENNGDFSDRLKTQAESENASAADGAELYDGLEVVEETSAVLNAGGGKEDGDGKNPDEASPERPVGARYATPDELTHESIFGYRPVVIYRLSEFEGPLDMLLSLIKEARINIEDIFVSDVTSQYVEIIKNTPKEELDFEYAGEFITLAAELVYLKSLRTLPKDDDDTELDEVDIEQGALINKIKEYALMKEQSEKLRKLETINRFSREPVYTEKDYRVCLTNFSLPKLVDAFARVLANYDRQELAAIPKKVVRERFSVQEQMEKLRVLLAEVKRMLFTDLFEDDYDKSDVITTFLAVLELMKYGKLTAEQDATFGDIYVNATEDTASGPVHFEENEDGEY